MSEKEFELLAGIVKDNQSKLSELESDLEEVKDTSNEFILNNRERIEELEKKYEELMMEWNGCEEDHKDLEEQIAELKELSTTNQTKHLFNHAKVIKLESVLSKVRKDVNWILTYIHKEDENLELSGEKDVSVRHGGSSPRQGLVRALTTNSKLGNPAPNDDFNQKTYDEGWKQGYKEGAADGMIENEKQKKQDIAEFIEDLNDIINLCVAYDEENEPYVQEKKEKWQQRLDD